MADGNISKLDQITNSILNENLDNLLQDLREQMQEIEKRLDKLENKQTAFEEDEERILEGRLIKKEIEEYYNQ